MVLVPDTEWRMYANVDNRLTLESPTAVMGEPFIVVPTELFTLMKDVLKIPARDSVTLFMPVNRAYATFGLYHVNQDKEYALWFYSRATLPAFLQPYITLDES